jgi:hypothetical protein
MPLCSREISFNVLCIRTIACRVSREDILTSDQSPRVTLGNLLLKYLMYGFHCSNGTLVGILSGSLEIPLSVPFWLCDTRPRSIQEINLVTGSVCWLSQRLTFLIMECDVWAFFHQLWRQSPAVYHSNGRHAGAGITCL